MKETCTKIIQENKDVESKWSDFKNLINSILQSKVPSKLSSIKNNLPWLTKSDIKKIAKKHKLFKKAKQTGKQEDFLIYKKQKRAAQKATRASHWRHINTVLLRRFIKRR